MSILLTGLFYTVGAYLLLNCCYLLLFAITGHIKSTQAAGPARTFRRIGVLLPAYKEDSVILDTARAALSHGYEGQHDVFVIADGLKPETIRDLREHGAGVLEVSFAKSTKGKALEAALAALPNQAYDIALVLDADNVMGQGFLRKINEAFEQGYQVVQGHRTAKNLDTPLALLDACNEEINNHLFRKGHQAMGLSAALIGSGMAFDFAYLKKLLVGIGEVVGEDKEIDFRIARDKVKVHYLHDAYVYDEKVATAKAFTGQRSRWMAAQASCLQKYVAQGFPQLLRHHNLAFFDKVMQTLLLPRILLMGILSMLLVSSFFLPYGPSSLLWAVMLLMAGAALLLALPGRFYKTSLIKALLRLPTAFVLMCLALMKSRSGGKSFIHTPHGLMSVRVEQNK